jgi:hypothetical protein
METYCIWSHEIELKTNVKLGLQVLTVMKIAIRVFWYVIIS